MTFIEILRAHQARYPAMQAEDIYKLLHQGCMGSEHAVGDREGVVRWMTRELADMGAGPADPLIDPIAPEGRIVRVHLRPFVAAGFDINALLDAFVQTANTFRGDLKALAAGLHDASTLCDAGALFTTLAAQGYPAIHHSLAYEQMHKPAYRVVAREFLPRPWLA